MKIIGMQNRLWVTALLAAVILIPIGGTQLTLAQSELNEPVGFPDYAEGTVIIKLKPGVMLVSPALNEMLLDIEAFFSCDRLDQLLIEKRMQWQKINQQYVNPALNYINEGNLEEAERWLMHGFFQTQDGWIAYHLGDIFQRQNKLDNARKYFQIAENNLPLPRYKQLARQSLTDLEKKPRIDYTSCILCSFSATAGLTCSNCGRMTCVGCIAEMLEVGKQTCVYCGGKFDV